MKLEKPIQSIIFPGETATSTYLIEGDDINKLTQEGSFVKVQIEYQNILTEKTHHTSRTFNIRFTYEPTGARVKEAINVPEKDTWD